LGGLSYVNILFGIFNNKDIKLENKEISTTLNSILGNLGIFLSSMTGFIINTSLTNFND